MEEFAARLQICTQLCKILESCQLNINKAHALTTDDASELLGNKGFTAILKK
jgi:hypothetical protein